jgi:hypothetical protein
MGGRVVALTHLMAVFVPLCGWTAHVAKSHKIMTRFGRHLSANCCRISTVTLYTTFLHYYLKAG